MSQEHRAHSAVKTDVIYIIIKNLIINKSEQKRPQATKILQVEKMFFWGYF